MAILNHLILIECSGCDILCYKGDPIEVLMILPVGETVAMSLTSYISVWLFPAFSHALIGIKGTGTYMVLNQRNAVATYF